MKILTTFLLLLPLSLSAQESVVGVTSPVSETITTALARDILTARAFMLPNGQKVSLIVMTREAISTKTLTYDILGITPSMFFTAAERAVSQGKLNQLRVVNSDVEMISTVAKTRGAVGYAQKYAVSNFDGVVRTVSLSVR